MKEDQKIAIYQTEDGQTQIDVRLENETVWLNVAQMASFPLAIVLKVNVVQLSAFGLARLSKTILLRAML